MKWNENFPELLKWSRKIDLFAKEYIILPINLGNCHWALVVVSVLAKSICYYDSMAGKYITIEIQLND